MMQEFAQQIEDVVREATYDIHTALPGTILEYDPLSGMATVKPSGTTAMKNGERLTYPEISKVPVVFPQCNAQKAVIAFPVMPGDGCLILICENDLKPWTSHGKETDSNMKFDLTNAVCIPGLFTEGGEAGVSALENNAVVIRNEDTTVMVKPDGMSAAYEESRICVSAFGVELACNGSRLVVEDDGIVMDGKLTVNGETMVYGSLEVTEDLTVGGDMAVSGGLNVDGTLEAKGSVVVNGDLTAKGSVSWEGG